MKGCDGSLLVGCDTVAALGEKRRPVLIGRVVLCLFEAEVHITAGGRVDDDIVSFESPNPLACQALRESFAFHHGRTEINNSQSHGESR